MFQILLPEKERQLQRTSLPLLVSSVSSNLHNHWTHWQHSHKNEKWEKEPEGSWKRLREEDTPRNQGRSRAAAHYSATPRCTNSRQPESREIVVVESLKLLGISGREGGGGGRRIKKERLCHRELWPKVYI